MNAKLKSLYWKLKKPDSVVSALKQIVDPSEVEKLEIKGFKAGALLEAISAEQGFDLGSLLMAVANLLEFAALDGQYSFDCNLCNDLQISESFLEANDALLFKHNQARLLLVADLNPMLKDFAKQHSLEICLGILSRIQKAWYNHRNFSLTSNAVDTKKLEFVLRNLVLDADKLGASQIEISAETGAYHFNSAGQFFEGNIHTLVSAALLQWLEGKSKIKVKLVSEWHHPVFFYKKAGSQTISVSWDSKQVKETAQKIYNLLLLEDDRLFSAVLKATLEKNGYKVFCFHTAESALAAISAKEFLPELVVSDLHLPGINGDEFLERLRDSHPNLPFVMLTSDQDQLIEAEIVQKGVGAYLKKNEDIRVILAWCSQLLKKYVD